MIFKHLINYIYPLKCVFCGEIFDKEIEVEICENCYEKIVFCGEMGKYPIANFYPSEFCRGVFCVCEYEGIIREAMIKYKFFNKDSYYRAFGYILGKSLEDYHKIDPFDAVLAIPLHKKRMRERGYNQSELIAQKVSEILNIKNISKSLVREKYTKRQSDLNKEERVENMKNAFIINDAGEIMLKRLLIIDDILTTGNTIEECSKILMYNGAKKVFAAVIASGRNNI